MFDLLISDEFQAGFDALPSSTRPRAERALSRLAENYAHPSLEAHRLQTAPDKWECKFTEGDRIIFEPVDASIRLWAIGNHSIIDRVRNRSFAATTAFRRMEETSAEIGQQQFLAPTDWTVPKSQEGGGQPFLSIARSHLRILGVPTPCIDAVRAARTPEELESLPLSKPETAMWLLELATSPDHGNSLFDPDRLIVRTTLDRLLGYSEGRIKRLMLNLSDEQRRYVAMDSAGPIFLRGSTGSGKTTVAVYRAIRLAEQGQRVLVVTRNRTLAGATQSLIEELVGPLPAEISVDRLDRWLLTFLRSRGQHIQLVDSQEERGQLLHEAVRDLRRENSQFARELDVPFLTDEIERVIKGQAIPTEDAYLEVRRAGRRERIGKELRKDIWAVFVSYRTRLAAVGKVDFMDLPALAEAELIRMRLDPPFDSVIVDEAQDLTAVQLRVTRLLTRAAEEDLTSAPVFMVGDVAQSLRSRGFSWREAGFRMNRSFSLVTNVRNSREIAAAANALLARNQTVTEDVDFIVPEQSDKRGLRPIVLRSPRRDLEDLALRETILALLEGQAFRLSDIAILCRTNEGCRFYVDLLTRTDVPARHHKDAKFEILSDEVKVLTIDSAKGLEFPVVFIPRMHDDHYPYDHRDIADPDERQMAVDRDRTSLYVGMTRACEALYLVTSPQRPSRFLDEMDGYLWFEEFTPEAKRSH